MIVALHGPNGVAILAECLACIGPYSGINKKRSLVYPEREGTCVIMIMALVVISSFSGKKVSFIVSYIAEFGFRIPGEWGVRCAA